MTSSVILAICIIFVASCANAASLHQKSAARFFTPDGKPLKESKVYTIKLPASRMYTEEESEPKKAEQQRTSAEAKSLKWFKTGKYSDVNLVRSMLPALLARLAAEKTARSHGMQMTRVDRKVGQSPVYTIQLPAQQNFYENEIDVVGNLASNDLSAFGSKKRRGVATKAWDRFQDEEYYAKKPLAVSDYHNGPRSDQVMLRRVNRLPVSFNVNGRPKSVSRAWNVPAVPVKKETLADPKSYRILKDFYQHRNMKTSVSAAKALPMLASRKGYSKSVHFKPTKAYNGKVSKIYILKDSNDLE